MPIDDSCTRLRDSELATIRPESIIVAQNGVVSVLDRRQFFDRLRHRKAKRSGRIECADLRAPRANRMDYLRGIVRENASMSALR